MILKNKTILLGVSGGIAAYKACMICSQLTQAGATVKVILTKAATQFVQPLTFQALSRQPVYVDTFDEKHPEVVSHIDLADHADLFLVAPATANVIGKLANGIADDMLSTTLLATRAPIWIAPAMNGHMLQNPAVQENIRRLQRRGIHFVQPGEGQLACGYVGQGRLAEPEEIIQQVLTYFATEQETSPEEREWWQGKRVLITAGPTREEIDPVRYISNYSSGKMGYALAGQARKLGAEVTLVSGPVDLEQPHGVRLIPVQSAEEMFQAVVSQFNDIDVVIKAAAVADYKPAEKATQKMKKSEELLTLTLEKTPDILQYLGSIKKDQILVGFAAETNLVEEYAMQKLERKNADFIVANDVTQEGAGFGTDTNIVTIYHSSGKKVSLPMLRKEEVALKILETVAKNDA